MWGNNKKACKKINSLIGRETTIMGDVNFSGGLLIDGKVYGNITASEDENATVTISEYGYVEGEIRIPNVIINGTIEGDVYATNHLDLAGKSRVHGNVFYNLIEMIEGAEVNGRMVHITDEQQIPMLESKTELTRLEQPDVVE
jgi:cytoskeletal protein CcmA (bactofilin family)